ncbi:MAG: carboxymuconolactone decarboxylase family protein [Frankiaceae bacterium]
MSGTNSGVTGEDPHVVPIDTQNPEAYRAAIAVARTVLRTATKAGLDRTLVELVNIRVSQINGCAACLYVHVRDALAAAETDQRIAVLPAWRDTTLFTDKERAALTLAESITTLPGWRAQAQDYAEVRQHLSADEFSAVSWIAITINAFNRISIVSRHIVHPPDAVPPVGAQGDGRKIG